MCNPYVVSLSLLALSVSILMGALMSAPNVAASDLEIFIPEPWPEEHHDQEGKVLAYKDGGRYQNPWMKDRPSPLRFFSTWFFGDDDSNIPSKSKLQETLPVKSPIWMSGNFTAARARLTWLGHASVLAEIDGFTVLADPIFSERASAVQFAGPQRYTKAPCTVGDLPPISAVVISHTHYDHLDLNTVSSLAKLQPSITWFVPMGMGQWIKDNTVATDENVRELTWWQESTLSSGSDSDDLRIILTPANHWGKRGLSDDNKSLWGSWTVLGPRTRFWFGGDTGYCEAFKQIGDKYGPFDLAAIPIGAYQPNWFMKYQHVHPGESVEIHKDIRSSKSLGIHWGTFKLTTENYLEPPSLLTTYLNNSDLDSKAFVAIDIGDSINLDL